MNVFLSCLICPLCVRCGSLQVGSNFFCLECEKEFLHLRIDMHTRSLEFKHKTYGVKYLINWTPGESDCLSSVVYLLKSRWSRSAWENYGRLFAKLFDFSFAKNKTCFIPVPSGKKQKMSFHTRYFSQFLTDFYQADRLLCLKSAGHLQSQKSLRLDERSRIKFEFSEEFTSLVLAYNRVVLVDDIITSGNTIKACLETLKPHLAPSCKIEIIALFSREKI